MSPLSDHPHRRQRQLANLQRGGGRPASAENRPRLAHGGYAVVAQSRLEAKQLEVYEALAVDAPLRDTDGSLPRHDTVAVVMLSKALCRLDDVEAFLTLRGVIDDSGRERTAVDLERRLRGEVADWLDSLGMTPRSRARLGVDLVRTVDLATAMSEPDPVRRAELMALSPAAVSTQREEPDA